MASSSGSRTAGDQYGAVQGHEVDCCNIDAGCADAIIQYSLFGEVVYG